MESKAIKIAKKILNEQKKISFKKGKDFQIIEKFLNLVERCESNGHGEYKS
jgi:hypothetical protein